MSRPAMIGSRKWPATCQAACSEIAVQQLAHTILLVQFSNVHYLRQLPSTPIVIANESEE